MDRVHAVEPAKTAFEGKAKIRRLLEAEGIPHTIVSSNFFAGYFLPSLAQPGFLPSPPRDKVIILGDGNPKAIFVNEEDIGTYTIRAAEDPRTLNKIVYLRPPGQHPFLQRPGGALGGQDRQDPGKNLRPRGGGPQADPRQDASYIPHMDAIEGSLCSSVLPSCWSWLMVINVVFGFLLLICRVAVPGEHYSGHHPQRVREG